MVLATGWGEGAARAATIAQVLGLWYSTRAWCVSVVVVMHLLLNTIGVCNHVAPQHY